MKELQTINNLPKKITKQCYYALFHFAMIDTYLAGDKLIYEKGSRGVFEAKRLNEAKENEFIYWLYIEKDADVDRRCKYLTAEEKAILRPLYENAGYTIDRLKELKGTREISYYDFLLEDAYHIFS